MIKTVCVENMCTGCMACINKCNKNAIELKKDYFEYNAIINEKLCVNCGACYKVCQVNNPIELHEPIIWKEGWALDNKIRKTSSSGGVATAIMQSFVRSGGEVCSCVMEKGEFIFKCVDCIEELDKFKGSKYVKSDPKKIYKLIEEKLKNGEKILFLGLPCQISALKKYIPPQLSRELYTIDLICHGTPNPDLLHKFLNEHGYDLKSISKLSFRKKDTYGLFFGEDMPIVSRGIRDSYLYSFLTSYNYTENCYECRYANVRRIADITLGDSWGTELPEEERKKGISLVLCQNEKGMNLLEMASLKLKDVNIEKSIENNKQLYISSIRPEKRELFMRKLKSGKKYDYAFACCDPGFWMRQQIKRILSILHLDDFMKKL